MTAVLMIGDPALRELAASLCVLAGIPTVSPEEDFPRENGTLCLTDGAEIPPSASSFDAAALFLPAAPSPETTAGLAARFGSRWNAFVPPYSYRSICAALTALAQSVPGELRQPKPSLPAEASHEERAVLSPEGSLLRGSRAVRLTEREAAFFRVLLRYGDRAVSRETILDEAWMGEGGRANVADVYAGYLRRKLRPLFGDGVLLSVRGVGYRLRLPCPVEILPPVSGFPE